jgi:lipopolysaccharide transport system permease protein
MRVNRHASRAVATAGMDSATPPAPADAETIRVEPVSGWRNLQLGEHWKQRELLYFLTWRDIKVRYKQTVLGASWAILQPFLATIVFSVVFGHLANISSEGVPYPAFALAGLVPWLYFSNAVTFGANSLVVTPELVTKIYFPRLLIPTSSVLGGLIDIAIGIAMLVGTSLYYGIVPGPHALLLVPLVALTVLTALAATLWLSALNVEYRDVRYVVPFLLQIWLFATPVAFPSSLVAEPWRTVLGLNPMAGVVEGFRWAMLGTSPAPGALVLASVGTALVLFMSGVLYFRRVEHRFADVI